MNAALLMLKKCRKVCNHWRFLLGGTKPGTFSWDGTKLLLRNTTDPRHRANRALALTPRLAEDIDSFRCQNALYYWMTSALPKHYLDPPAASEHGNFFLFPLCRRKHTDMEETV